MASKISPRQAALLYNLAFLILPPFVFYKIARLVLEELEPARNPVYTAKRPLAAQDPAKLPYPPDCLPGARDVDTPYGNIRVYEWGPEDGRKLSLIHI